MFIKMELMSTAAQQATFIEFEVHYTHPKGQLLNRSLFEQAFRNGYTRFVQQAADRTLDLGDKDAIAAMNDALGSKLAHIEYIEDERYGFAGGVAVLQAYATCPHGHKHPYLIYGAFAPVKGSSKPSLEEMLEKALGIKVTHFKG